MPVLIDFNNYPELNKYDVFAENTITNIGETIINNGYWYASNSEGVLLTSGNPPSGINETEIIVTTASNQLDNLIIDLTNVTYNLNNSTTLTNNQDQTFKPSINYNGNNIKYENNNKLIFDGENDENSQFFITIKKTPWLDNKHVVFGIIISGFDIIKKMESIDTDDNDKPLKKVVITKCGLVQPEKN